MSKKNIILLTAAFFMAATSASAAKSTMVSRSVVRDAERSKPNVILMMADDLGWGCVGYNGSRVIKTPSLDKMAEEGVKFNRFYAAAPVCSPTRSSCLTGRHPYRTGVFSANTGILRPEELTLAEILNEQGYTTGHFGKWHLGTFSTTEADANRGGTKHPELYNPPSEHGFDTYFSTESKVPTWDPMKKPADFADGESEGFGWNYIKTEQASLPYGTYYWSPAGKESDNLDGDDSRVIMDRAIPFIEKAAIAKKPFFAVIWFHAPHLPCVAGPKYAAMYQEQNFKMQQYAGCITAMDEQVGRLRNRLKELGINDNTILCFTSDNGPENGTPGETGGFKGRKRSLHDGGVRVPGLITWPDKVRQPIVIDTPCVTSDYLPTIIDALGIKLPKNANPLDGVSILPLLEGKELNRPAPIGFASGNQKVFNGIQYKLYMLDNAAPQLYDMLKDPHEQNNIAGEHPESVVELRKGFDLWYLSCKASFEGREYGTNSLARVPQQWPVVKKKEARVKRHSKK